MSLRVRKSNMQHDVMGDHHVSEASVIYMDKEDAFKKEWEGFNVFLVKRKKTPLRRKSFRKHAAQSAWKIYQPATRLLPHVVISFMDPVC